MSYVNRKVEELRKQGFYSAERVDPDTIYKIVNMAEWEYYSVEVPILESYLGLLAQQVGFIQQECNISEAKEIELGTDFKINALPLVLGEKIRSVEERYIYASTLTPDLAMKYQLWQNAILESTLKKDLGQPIIERLNVLKKIYDDRRQEGKNKHIHKYSDGSMGGS